MTPNYRASFTKPHLVRRWGVWACTTLVPRFVCGCGYTPKDAYDEWVADGWSKSLGV